MRTLTTISQKAFSAFPFQLSCFSSVLSCFLFAALTATAQHCPQAGMMPPAVTTGTVTFVSGVSATVTGNVTNDGGGTVTHRGMVWATTPSPTTADALTNDGTGTGGFTSTLTGLVPGTTYHVRAFAANASGTVYGAETAFTMPVPPTVVTAPVTDIGMYIAISGGEVTSDGGGTVTARGVSYSLTPNPTIGDNTVASGSGTGSFVSSLTNLVAGQTYYLRAYATNTTGTAYGNEVVFSTECFPENTFNPDLTYGTMTDQEGNVYRTIVIGTQEWMAENLKTSVYRNGDLVTTGVDNLADWVWNEAGLWTYFENAQSYNCPFGKLYNWYAVNDSRGICPTGWSVPNDLDWFVLENYLDETVSDPNQTGFRGTVIGHALRSVGGFVWIAPNTGAVNSSGFSALPAGRRWTASGEDDQLYSNAYWWSRNQADDTNAWIRSVVSGGGQSIRFAVSKMNGLSIRCIRE